MQIKTDLIESTNKEHRNQNQQWIPHTNLNPKFSVNSLIWIIEWRATFWAGAGWENIYDILLIKSVSLESYQNDFKPNISHRKRSS